MPLTAEHPGMSGMQPNSQSQNPQMMQMAASGAGANQAQKAHHQ